MPRIGLSELERQKLARAGGGGILYQHGWRPIDTAPKDGKRILVAVPGDVIPYHIFLVWWLDGWCYDLGKTPILGTPTKWQPLPHIPPEESE